LAAGIGLRQIGHRDDAVHTEHPARRGSANDRTERLDVVLEPRLVVRRTTSRLSSARLD
jgi:hypothetical protein